MSVTAAVTAAPHATLSQSSVSKLLAGGTTLSDALANTGLAMYNYMTPLAGLTVNTSLDRYHHLAAAASAPQGCLTCQQQGFTLLHNCCIMA